MIKLSAVVVRGDKTILNVNRLTFEQGKRYALIGANGSGKTTLLKVLCRQIAGDIEGSYTVSYMPQFSFAFDMSAEANVLVNVGKKQTVQRELARQYMQALDLTALSAKNGAKLSGGEKQRVALARTLVSDCEVIALDEPTASMDVEHAQKAIELIRKATEGKTLVFSTHSVNQAKALADEIIFLSGGEVAASTTPNQLDNCEEDSLKAFLSFNV